MPAYAKTILVLANSYKTSGRCLAGVEVGPAGIGSWVRPVSNRLHGEISEQERMFADGRDPKVGDIVCIPFLRRSPHPFQAENQLIDPRQTWSFERQASGAEYEAAVDRSGRRLWAMGGSSTHGRNDRVREVLADAAEGSLRLIEVSDLVIRLQMEAGREGEKRKLRGRFSCGGTTYLLGITDPVVRRRYFFGPDGEFPVGRALLCVSLGDPFGGYAYKLIATVLLPKS